MSMSHDKAWALNGCVHELTALYESRLGLLPIWLHELDLERIVPLLECCLRIGMQLPIGDALEADEGERRARQAQKGIRPSRRDS